MAVKSMEQDLEGGLEQDLEQDLQRLGKKQERRLMWNKIQKVVLGAAIIGLIVK